MRRRIVLAMLVLEKTKPEKLEARFNRVQVYCIVISGE